jgi:hypothetical protein
VGLLARQVELERPVAVDVQSGIEYYIESEHYLALLVGRTLGFLGMGVESQHLAEQVCRRIDALPNHYYSAGELPGRQEVRTHSALESLHLPRQVDHPRPVAQDLIRCGDFKHIVS